MKCSSGKKCFEDEFLATEALIQNHVINDHTFGAGPINVYECDMCGYWHFTSKGVRHEVLDDPDLRDRIKREREGHFWERRLK